MKDILTQISPSFLVFVPIALVTVLGAAGVAFSRNIVYSAFSLLAAFVGVVGLFAFLSADFLAVVQLMVYVGGVLVLILFAVMLTQKITHIKNSNPLHNVLSGGALFFLLLLVLLGVVFKHNWISQTTIQYEATTDMIGNAFLGPYLLPFEIAGVLLLAALLAAVVVARKEMKTEEVEKAPSKGESS